MSIYFNQTNLTPGTSFASGGGGSTSNFPQGIFTSSIVGLSSINGVSYSGSSGSNFPNGVNLDGITVEGGGASLLIQPANEIFLGAGAGTTALYGVSTISYINNVTTIPFVTSGVSGINLNSINQINSNAPVTVGGSNLAFIQYGAQTADATGVTITLPTPYKTVGYTVLLTQTDVAPTIVPWAKITSNDTFIITGDTGENVCWMTIGAL